MKYFLTNCVFKLVRENNLYFHLITYVKLNPKWITKVNAKSKNRKENVRTHWSPGRDFLNVKLPQNTNARVQGERRSRRRTSRLPSLRQEHVWRRKTNPPRGEGESSRTARFEFSGTWCAGGPGHQMPVPTTHYASLKDASLLWPEIPAWTNNAIPPQEEGKLTRAQGCSPHYYRQQWQMWRRRHRIKQKRGDIIK